jgi:predicted nucleotidyltransferase
MLVKDNLTKVLGIFFDNPIPEGSGFQLREISRTINLAPKSVKMYLEVLKKEDLIIAKKHRVHKYPIYYANRDNTYFKLLKKLDLIRRIEETGLLKYIDETCMPQVVFLFGSASRGEDISTSDIDLYVQSGEKRLKLDKYEKLLKRKINIFFEKNFIKLSKELKNNIINGDKLKGYLNI